VNQHLRLAIDHLREGVQVIASDWRYLYLNDSAAQHERLPVEALIGQRVQDCYPGIENTPLFRALTRVMTTGTPEKFRNEFEDPNGDRRWFDLRVAPVPAGICVLSIDVTEEVRAAERLRLVELHLQQAQKMEAIGRLAGGIAHDFNNQLTVILGFTQMLLEQHTTEEMCRELREIEAASQRAATLVRQLLALGKRQVMQIEPVALSEVIDSARRLLDRALGDDVTCETQVDAATAPVMADRGQLEHVIISVAVNARDAMPRGGQLTIGLETVRVDDANAARDPEIPAGRYTVLSMRDTGHGMDEATKGRIFEPFFTTKEPAQGSGLGLSMVYGIVKQMNGHITVDSAVNQGTTFRLYLPAIEGSAGDGTRQTATARPDAARATEVAAGADD
jgi:two-component system, cell cycle sensor histidine kinase and response regulator CckA